MDDYFIFVDKYWSYVPDAISKKYFDLVYQEISDKCSIHYSNRKIYGKIYTFKKRSCYLTESLGAINFDYLGVKGIPVYNWTESPTIIKIKNKIREIFETDYDYCLVNLYRDGNDQVSWHSDNNDLEKDICSVSLGVTRKFKLRKKDKSKTIEFKMKNGDILQMHKGCQKKYDHCVPQEKRIKPPRINLTFRKF